jgi:hypothetical protein
VFIIAFVCRLLTDGPIHLVDVKHFFCGKTVSSFFKMRFHPGITVNIRKIDKYIPEQFITLKIDFFVF